MKLKEFLQGIPFLAWVVIYTAFCWGLFAAILGSVTPELRQELGNYQALGWLMTAWASGSIVGAMQGGRLAQRLAARKLLRPCAGSAVIDRSRQQRVAADGGVFLHRRSGGGTDHSGPQHSGARL